jgi:hypothetical protein
VMEVVRARSGMMVMMLFFVVLRNEKLSAMDSLVSVYMFSCCPEVLQISGSAVVGSWRWLSCPRDSIDKVLQSRMDDVWYSNLSRADTSSLGELIMDGCGCPTSLLRKVVSCFLQSHALWSTGASSL